MLLKLSTARNRLVFMTDSSDHVTGKTGLTLTITASKDGAAFASVTPTVTERGNGWYNLALTTSHTDTLGDLALHVTGTGADPADLSMQVVADLPGALPAITAGWLTAAGIAADAITAAKIADGAIDRATFAADTGLQPARSNTAAGGGATSVTLDGSASAVTDFYKNALIYLTGGTGVGQGRFCTAYNGTTKVATVGAWATNPDNTSTFAVIPFDSTPGATAPTAAAVATAVWTDLLSGSDFSTAASIGKLLKDDINVSLSSIANTLGTPANGDVTGDLQNLLDSVQGVGNGVNGVALLIGTGGASLDSIPWNAAWDAEVQSEAADAIAAAGIPTAAQNAAAWGARVVGNSRTADFYLQGGINKFAFDVPTAGSWTLYASDDVDPAQGRHLHRGRRRARYPVGPRVRRTGPCESSPPAAPGPKASTSAT
jgi:hypothetical protein